MWAKTKDNEKRFTDHAQMPLALFLVVPMKCHYHSRWGWICLLFAAQAVGSLGIARLFQMDLRGIVIPVMILSAGTIVSAVFRAVSESSRLGKWQWWVPALIYALFIFALSNRAYPDAQPIFSTKVFHPIEYLSTGCFHLPGTTPGP
jgi:hypothetical protein